MNNHINTLLFDLDGTLINTNELIITTYLHTLEKYYPGQYHREDVLPFMGPPLKEVFGKLDPERADEMIREYRAFNHANHDKLVTEFPTVFETIKTLKEKGFKLGVVTTKLHDTTLKGLNFTKLEPFFEVVVTFDDVTKAKPDPEPVYKALEQFKTLPEEAIMIGDNYHDILAGKNAGTQTAGAAWSLKGKDYLAQYKPDYMLNQMSDLLTILGV